ncbi:hypothetical protein VP01_4654g2 [Puccinia sorghi]|uniref:Uncharacterized protein n=1 Tax=Puccinia sorghi TaxID=27349 RepID=A0A0L6UQ84_9BASI|nr:hypothetical protein VP01_4654g2 [Puccinia sorghi]
MKKVFESCLDSWKAKIQDGVTNNREAILVEDEITISQLKPIRKRPRPSESTSTTPANKKTRTSNNPSSLGNNAGDVMAAAGLSGAAQKGKGNENEKASSKKTVLLFLEKPEVDIKGPVSALELCIGLPPYKRSVYTQHMAALGSGKGLGTSAMELGSLMFTMVDAYLVWINQNGGAFAQIKNINLPTRLSTPLMEAPRKASFMDIIRATTLMPSGPVWKLALHHDNALETGW